MRSVIQYDDLTDEIALVSGGIPDIAISQLIPMCVQRYASETLCIKEQVSGIIKDGVFIRADNCNSELTQSGRYEVIALESVKFRGNLVPFLSDKLFDTDGMGCCTLQRDHEGSTLIRFHNIDDTDKPEVSVTYVLTPKHSATSCVVPRNSGLFKRAVTSLCLHYLYSMPNRDWMNAELSAHHLLMYENMLIEGKRIAKNNDLPNHRECKFSW